MDIRTAKEQIRNAVIAYRTRDEYGRTVIPVERQRPVFLIGAPGIGKTAIVEQIAKELGIGLVSYSITHHTRQSALGLPFISEKEYDGKHYRVSEYTMSEIIAAVYEKQLETGINEGILFLDEINCVSETLTPAMLQFLQYKVFGQHRVPDGWIVITAGNPPEYNSSVREFDMVTSDRLKKIETEPDIEVWRKWAVNEGVHQAVISYLDIRRDDFYHAENDIDGRRFVTPRGWTDLSEMLKLYEVNGLETDEFLVEQYLQDKKTAASFTAYYELWKKYEKEYGIKDILEGRTDDGVMERAKTTAFDERISIIGLLLDDIRHSMSEVLKKRRVLAAVKEIILGINDEADVTALLSEIINDLETSVSGALGKMKEERETERILGMIKILKEFLKDGVSGREELKDAYRIRLAGLRDESERCAKHLENMFGFIDEAYGRGPEAELVMTELTAGDVSAEYISIYGSESYFRYSKELLFYERKKELKRRIEEADL